MSDKHEILKPASWREDEQGVPRSLEYGDVYHGAAGALPQARHVFLAGNGLPGRWRGRAAFTIAETGFGLGHNFLAAWRAWLDDPARSGRLHYLAFEAHPFAAEDLLRAWRRLPDECRPLAHELAGRWPALLPGVHRLELQGGRVVLTLMFGDIRRLARQAQARVDAFFLDGFAPRVNPDMWSPAVFGQLRRLAVAGATAATWCAAGQVRRDLRDAGFLVEKAPGLAGKREMTVAVLRPGLGAAPPEPDRRRVAVVGGGLAGAGVAQALAARGHEVEVWDPLCALDVDPALRRRGAAALVPALSPDDDTRSRLSRAGLARARARWLDLDGPARPQACGALVCAQSEAQADLQRRALARLGFPADWVRWLDPAQAGLRAGVGVPWGGLWFAEALRACPGELIAALLSLPGVTRRACAVGALAAAPGGGWSLRDAEGRELGRADHLVLANALHAPALLAGVVPVEPLAVLSRLAPLAGQVSLYPAGEAAVPRCVLSGRGYCLPPRDGWGVVGSTYRPDASEAVADEAGHQDILARVRDWVDARDIPWLGRGAAVGWAGWRAATRDHLPVIGPVPDRPGLWLACAYGSRGLSWSALAGDLIGAWMDGEPVPAERELVRRIAPR
ncbi:tRNA (5-methylaminomethyl-2-thiouridylate)-methyltransferase [Castellaniella defragrans 65Phen]|uniref:tRNA 5-methylaminomethyl-2-thiouridine biosynthesis bifunctional protein MnmC n=1 Tax=Castellaniella defragrans (strain DSM 12143 / CCUG 39792 / 65Phen) TaxID=1437824 RepID=W8X114_CASD6|nr:FAD-dependent 5-carboxymethylaminomethyl-2-thiouridine(34) oxidoreductase MnmC [Castellaniella defragrans]CDM25763.1 tRNA (5-methylaminomethyl-2-thiouridylate)-methyltransferase [Castellaniella defragrans 65Phen]